MRKRPLSDCREEKKGRKRAWRPYFCNWLLHPYFKKTLGFPLTSECCTCGIDPHQTAERKRKRWKRGMETIFLQLVITSIFLKNPRDFHWRQNVAHAETTLIGLQRGKRKAEKGHGGHISVIGYCTHILKKPWDFHWRQNVAHVGSTLIRLQRGKEKDGKGAWRPYFCNWLLHPYF